MREVKLCMDEHGDLYAIAEDLVKAFNDGYAQGKKEAEFYMLHCGDETPVTNGDKIRAMDDEELIFFFWSYVDGSGKTVEQWREWLKQEAEE